MLCSWVNQLFRLSHGFNSYVNVYQAGYYCHPEDGCEIQKPVDGPRPVPSCGFGHALKRFRGNTLHHFLRGLSEMNIGSLDDLGVQCRDSHR